MARLRELRMPLGPGDWGSVHTRTEHCPREQRIEILQTAVRHAIHPVLALTAVRFHAAGRVVRGGAGYRVTARREEQPDSPSDCWIRVRPLQRHALVHVDTRLFLDRTRLLRGVRDGERGQRARGDAI